MTGPKADQNWRTRHIDERLGPRVERLHNARGFTRADVARLLGIPDATLQNVEEGVARMTASQLWQICGATGIEIADVFAGLPSHIYRTKADFEKIRELKTHPVADAGDQEVRRYKAGFSGLGEPSWGLDPEGSLRDDLADLGRAVSKLPPEDRAFLIRTAKGLRR